MVTRARVAGGSDLKHNIGSGNDHLIQRLLLDGHRPVWQEQAWPDNGVVAGNGRRIGGGKTRRHVSRQGDHIVLGVEPDIVVSFQQLGDSVFCRARTAKACIPTGYVASVVYQQRLSDQGIGIDWGIEQRTMHTQTAICTGAIQIVIKVEIDFRKRVNRTVRHERCAANGKPTTWIISKEDIVHQGNAGTGKGCAVFINRYRPTTRVHPPDVVSRYKTNAFRVVEREKYRVRRIKRRIANAARMLDRQSHWPGTATCCESLRPICQYSITQVGLVGEIGFKPEVTQHGVTPKLRGCPTMRVIAFDIEIARVG